MRLAGTPLARALAGLSLTILATAVCLSLSQPPAIAAEILAVSAEKGISRTSDFEVLTVRCPVGAVSAGAEVVIHLSGPADVAQVGDLNPILEKAGTVTYDVNPATDSATDGSLQSTIVIPSETLQAEGAYRADVELVAGATVQATGSVWLGKVAAGQDNVDVAFIWPLTLGIHRNADGIFFDRVLEDAVAGVESGMGDVGRLAALGMKYPNWKFTLALEPVVLSQLREMSDGYVRLDDAGAQEQVGADAEPAKNASAALAALKDLVVNQGRDVLVTPYAGPSMGALANSGWRDGLEQVQLGKQVTQQILGLGGTLTGAYASDLDITTDSLASYGQASIDHVVVSSSVAGDLTETLSTGSVTARVRDADNQRVTLVLADEQMQEVITSPPWDVGRFLAGLAAELASGSRRALVITPAPGTVVPPAEYLQAIGEALQRFSWIHTLTVTDLVRAHSPGSRPILLDRASAPLAGYIARGMRSSIEVAHQAVQDIVDAAGSGRQSVENAQALLFTAESAYWSLPGTIPKAASVGLLYAERARALAEAEMAKITIAGFGSTSVTGQEGTLRLLIDNAATYPMKVEIRLNPEGLMLPGGNSLQVEVQPGRTDIPITVRRTKGTSRLQATVAAGKHLLGDETHSIRFITVLVFLPWAAGALVLIVVAAVALAVRHRRKRKRHARP